LFWRSRKYPSAQRWLAPTCLEPLVRQSRETNNGSTGLQVALTPEEVREYRAAAAFRLTTPSAIFGISPLEPTVESSLHLKFAVLSEELAASHMCHKSTEASALLWIGENFTGQALAVWAEGLAVAKQTPTTSSIGTGSVLYRAIMRMLKAYENSNAADKARVDFAKLRWSVTMSSTQLQFAKVLTDYSLVAARTAAMDEVDRLEPLSFNWILVRFASCVRLGLRRRLLRIRLTSSPFPKCGLSWLSWSRKRPPKRSRQRRHLVASTCFRLRAGPAWL
jgi:hypothetical protein